MYEKITILVIEDDEFVREITLRFLIHQGFTTIGAENGEVGIELIRQLLPEVILCDINMLRLNGFEVLKRVRQDPATANTPFIFLTANTSEEDIAYGLALGADCYLKKANHTCWILRGESLPNLNNVFYSGDYYLLDQSNDSLPS